MSFSLYDEVVLLATKERGKIVGSVVSSNNIVYYKVAILDFKFDLRYDSILCHDKELCLFDEFLLRDMLTSMLEEVE
jgi:hypothetical protein